MTLARTLALAAFAAASLPLLAQQPGSPSQQPAQEPGTTTASSPAQQQEATPQQSMPQTATASALSPVQGELVDQLDTKTAKTGDAVVIKTQSTIKTADGTEIPKGSKLVGRIAGVKPIGEGSQNSQVALQFDHAELGGGQKLPIHAEIQELSTSENGAAMTPDATTASPGASPASGATAPGGMNGSTAAGSSSTQAQTQPQMGNSSPANPPAGTIVARNGNIAIRATSIPGVLLATNAPGQQDPRLAQSSGILLGPQHDIHLDSGTHVVVGVSLASAAGPGGQ
jgi:hypothetical protein